MANGIGSVADAVDVARKQGAHWLDRPVKRSAIERLFSHDLPIETRLLCLVELRTQSTDDFIVDSYGIFAGACVHLLG
jgi:hypothetical protein